MKKIFTIVSVCVVAVGLRAQGNLSIENWQMGLNVESPAVWYTLNELTNFGLADSASVLKGKSAYGGLYAARIRPVVVTFFGRTWLQGMMMQQYASTARPKSLRFAYKYSNSVGNSDPALGAAYFYKGATNDSNNIIGQALVWINTTNSYIYATEDITWKNGNTPDTATISFMTGVQDTLNVLTIDDVSLSNFSAGTTDIRESDMKVYQSIDGSLHIEGLESWMQQVSFFDAMGRKVFSLPAKAVLSLPSMPAGIYYFEISGRDSRVTGKTLIGS